LLSLAELLGMSLWFTGTAVIPEITKIWHAGLALGSWLTIAVQIGFSLGAITFALFNIPDVFSPIKVFVFSAVLAAAANAAFAMFVAQPLTAILLRGVTGFFLAGVYPVGMKIIAGWFQRGRGLALGIMIGALTVGSAVPHGANAIGGIPWRGVVLLGSVQAVIGAMIVALTEVMPFDVRTSGFSLAYSLATTFGGFTAAICTWLIATTGDNASRGYWMSAAAICGLAGTFFVYRMQERPALSGASSGERVIGA